MGYHKQTPIDRSLCPKGHGAMNLKNSWKVKGKGRGKKHKETGFRVELYSCETCGMTTRQYYKLAKEEKEK